jgi:hypothetical protein
VFAFITCLAPTVFLLQTRLDACGFWEGGKVGGKGVLIVEVCKRANMGVFAFLLSWECN